MIYGRTVADILPKFGGKAVFAADVTFLSLGQVEELWDEVAIAMYPARADMVRMSLSEEWRTARFTGQQASRANSTLKRYYRAQTGTHRGQKPVIRLESNI